MPIDFDKCVKDVKTQLMKDNHKMKNDEAESRAYAICTSQFKKSGKKTTSKIDSDGHIIIAENVKVVLDGYITEVKQ